MVQDGGNPAFSRANALTMLRIDLLLLKLLFGSFPGSQKGPKMVPKWTRKGTANGSRNESEKGPRTDLKNDARNSNPEPGTRKLERET